MSCRAFREYSQHSTRAALSPLLSPSGDSSGPTPHVAKRSHQTHWHSLPLWQRNFWFSIQIRNLALWSVIRRKRSSLIGRFVMFWQYPEANHQHQTPLWFWSPVCTGSLICPGKNMVTQRKQVCWKSHCISK